MPLQNVANDNDNVVLNEAELLSNGGIWEKIRAFDSLIKSFWTLPRKECEELLIKLAKNNQPTDVRFHVALRLLKGVQIDKNTYEALVNTLLNANEPL
jgi:actin-related protein